MYRCDRCKKEVEELPVEYNPCDYGSTTVYEKLANPYCNCGGEFEEVEEVE